MTTTETLHSSDALTMATGQIVAQMVATAWEGSIEEMILGVRRALTKPLEDPKPEPAPPQQPAVAINRSIRPEAIYCLECGTPHTSIKRHLSAQHGLTPEAYRAKWNLRPDYPMVTVAYSAKRSELAKANGLGKKGSH